MTLPSHVPHHLLTYERIVTQMLASVTVSTLYCYVTDTHVHGSGVTIKVYMFVGTTQTLKVKKAHRQKHSTRAAPRPSPQRVILKLLLQLQPQKSLRQLSWILVGLNSATWTQTILKMSHPWRL
jgi:hypothetical protein